MTYFAQALSAALLHFLWQGLLVAVVLRVALALLRERSANSRYLASCAALAAMAALPLATTLLFYLRQAPANVVSNFAASQTVALGGVAVAARWDWLAAVQKWALPVWAAGVLILSVRLVWACRQIAALKKCGEPAAGCVLEVAERLRERLGVTQPVRVLITALADGPSVAGWLRPVVLLPAATLLNLTQEQLESVLAHEFAHIRRHDYLVNLLQTLVETVLFYHPAVWWASARMRHERELCCDDAAVSTCGDALRYARALAALEKLRMSPPALAMGSTGGSLLYRIQRLAGMRPGTPGSSKLTGLAALVLGLVCLAANMRWAHAQEAQQKAIRVNMIVTSDRAGVSVDTGNAVVMHRVPVEYPEAAREQGVQGTVVVEATLAADGTVDDARVVSGPAALRRTALQSVLQWHFVKDVSGSTRQVAIVFDAKAAGEAEPGEVGGDIALSPTIVDQPAEFEEAVGKFEALRVSRDLRLVEMPLAGSVLKSIQVSGLADGLRRELLGSLPVHEGDLLTDSLVERTRNAVKQFDEHLEVNMGLNEKKEAELHISAPGMPGIFRLQLDQK